jgi:hypothetical protein
MLSTTPATIANRDTWDSLKTGKMQSQTQVLHDIAKFLKIFLK